MTNKTTNKFSPEVRARAVRLVLDHRRRHASVVARGGSMDSLERFASEQPTCGGVWSLVRLRRGEALRRGAATNHLTGFLLDSG
jgi:hypothetical protein